MEDKRRRRRSYKFTGKKVSKRGIVSVILSASALASMGAVVWMSFGNRGNGSVYLGSMGILAMLLSVLSVVIAIMGLREEDTFKVLPATGLGMGIVSTILWMTIYVRGFM